MEQIIITHPDGKQIPLFSRKNISGVSKATQKTALLSDDIVSITLSSATPLDLHIGDTVQIYGKPYKLNQLPEPTKDGERRYTYELRLEGLQYDLIDVHYHLPEDAYGETYYSDLAGHLQVLMWNINRIFPGKWVLGTYPEGTEYKNITNSEKNCLQVLQELCSDYGVEFEIASNGKTNTLNIKAQAGITHTFTLKFGRGKGLYQLQRKNVNNAGITNRLFVYGGTENLGRNYGHTKLCLPGTTRLTSYIEDKESIALYGVKEGEKNYSDIKPQRVGTVTALGANVITFADNTMFDLNAKESDGKTTKYLIEGTSAKIKFESGQLAGYEFDLHSYDHNTHTFVINKFQDENGLVFPSEESGAFQIAVGDKYCISDIQLPDEYKQAAESELAEAGNKYLPTVSQPQVSYKLALTEGFFIALWGKEVETEILHVGDYINVEDEQIGVNKAVRITQIERDLLKRHSYDITLSDTITKTTTVRVLNDLQNLNEIITINKLADPAKARRRWMATQELLNMVFDTEGDYYSEKIKPLSIETQMLSVGAKSTQFTLQDVMFQPNYGGNANTLTVSSGRLAHYAIDEDGVRYWKLSGATYSNLTTATAYYIYARCSRAESKGTIILSSTAKTVESEVGYYNFLVGVLNSVVTDTGGKNQGRLVSLTYGSSTINGRFIRTGRIESNAGTCYFDLDNNEIGGVIKFVKNDGTTSNVTDVDDKATEVKNYINNTLPGILNEIQAQLDGQIEQFFEEYDPTTSNAPANTWTTSQLKEEHLGDLFYNTATGAVFRFIKENGTYKWKQLSNEETAQALAIANDALDLAKEKRRIFTLTPYTPYEVGDLWVQGTTGDIMRCQTARASGDYTSSDWEKASKYTDDTSLATFIDGTYTDAVNGLTAQIDSKRRVFVATPNAPYDVGDLWVDGKELRRCITAKAPAQIYDVNDWVVAVYYDNTKTTIDGGIVTSGTIQVAGDNASILAGITGNGTTDASVRFWAGASFENKATAPFRVQQDGTAVMTKAAVEGTIDAKSGYIGGFKIGTGSISSIAVESDTTGDGLSLHDKFIRFASSYTWASIGTNVLPSTSEIKAIGYFTNSEPNEYGNNYGIIVDVSGGMSNIGIASHGAIVCDSYVADYGIAKLVPSTNEIVIPGNATRPTMFKVMVKFIYSNSGIGLPSYESVCSVLGIDTATAFAVRMAIICDVASTKTGFITGRNTSDMADEKYPYRINNSGEIKTNKRDMTKGNILEYLLSWDGNGSYYAYLLSAGE